MRSMMTVEQIQHNCDCFKEQMSKFIDFSEGKALMVNNADWLMELNYIEPVSYTHLDVYKRQPYDGHDVPSLIETLNQVKNINKPVLIHVRTVKGKGYNFAECSPNVFHGVGAVSYTHLDVYKRQPMHSTVCCWIRSRGSLTAIILC